MSKADRTSIVSQLCLQCTAMFKALLPHLMSRIEVPKLAVRSYRQSCTSFILWVDEYDAHLGGLDGQLHAFPALRRLTYRLLVGLSDTITENLVRKFKLSGILDVQLDALRAVSAMARMDVLALGNDNLTDSSNEDSGDEEDSLISSTQLSLEDVLRDLSNYVKCLSDLAPLIHAWTPTLAVAEKGKAPTMEFMEAAIRRRDLQLYEDQILRLYPATPDHLLKRLGKANLACSQRLQNEKETSLPALTKLAHEETRTVAGNSLIDSGLGSSIDTRSTHASTVMQYTRKDFDSISIPKLPEGARRGEPFDCPACGQNMVFSTVRNADRDWYKHFFRDLRPWLCVGPVNTKCDEPFLSREDWVQHLAIFHRPETRMKPYRCPFCQEEPGDGERENVQHLAGHLEEIAIGAFLCDVAAEDTDIRPTEDLEELESKRLSRWMTEDAAGYSKHLGLNPESESEPELESEIHSDSLNPGHSMHSIVDATTASTIPDTSLGSRPFPCDDCGGGFKTYKTLQRHRKTSHAHNDLRVYTCKCGFKSTRKDNFMGRHLGNCKRSHSPSDVFTCICSFMSDDAETMITHFSNCPRQRHRGRPQRKS